MSIFRNHLPIMGASGAQATGYTIDQSIRFNDGDSPYMARTFGTPTDAKKWTMSGWAKIAGVTDEASGGVRFLDAGGSAGNDAILSIGSGYAGYEKIYFWDRTSSSYNWRLETTALFRDPSAWYHVVFVYDSDNSVSSERMRLYLNGERITDFSSETYPSSGEASRINTAVAHRIGATVYASSNYSNGYTSEMHFIDGYAYGPEYFGEFKEDTDIWIPKEFTGSYGNNGYKIDGRDASDLGDDESGNGNDFTTSGLATTDKRTDSPTNNHATWNPLVNATPAFANGNIDVAFAPASSTKWAKTVMNFTLPNTGTWYWEGQEFNNVINPATGLGIVDADIERLDDKSSSNRPAENMGTFTGIKVYSGPGQSLATYEWKNGSATSTSGAAILSTSRLGFLWEPENNRFTIYDDGSQYQQFTSINTGNYVFVVGQETGTNLYFRLFVEANDWTQTPTGISSLNALNTKNIGS